MELKMSFHMRTGRRIVEVFDNAGRFVAAIYPDETTNGIKIVSKYFESVEQHGAGESLPEVPDIVIAFERDVGEKQDVYKRRARGKPGEQ